MTGVEQLIKEALDPVGWYEFIKPGGSTTHIAYVHEGGWVYLPEGPDVVTEEDFTLASAADRFWKLGRVKDLADELVSRLPKEVTTVEEVCDGGCDYNSGPEETCSLHGRPVAEVWDIAQRLGERRDEYRAAIDEVLALTGDIGPEARRILTAVLSAGKAE